MIKGPTEILYDIAASYLKEKLMKVSNCCGAPFYEPGWPDNDICSACKEHADAIEQAVFDYADRMNEDSEKEIVYGPNDPGDENNNIIITESNEADKRAINKVSMETSKEDTAT